MSFTPEFESPAFHFIARYAYGLPSPGLRYDSFVSGAGGPKTASGLHTIFEDLALLAHSRDESLMQILTGAKCPAKIVDAHPAVKYLEGNELARRQIGRIFGLQFKLPPRLKFDFAESSFGLQVGTQELELIRASIQTAAHSLFDKAGERNRQIAHLQSGKNGGKKEKKLDEALIPQLAFDICRSLNHPLVLAEIVAAAQREDVIFFERLGRILTDPAKTLVEVITAIKKDEDLFLLTFWLDPRLSLAFLNPKDIDILFKCLTDPNGAWVAEREQTGSIAKRASRLGLVPLKGKKLTVQYFRASKKILISPGAPVTRSKEKWEDNYDLSTD